MDKNQYVNYLKDQYKDYNKPNHNKFVRIDVMLAFNDIIASNKNVILKGAMNLYKNFEYARENLTKDIDYSITGKPIAEFAKNLSTNIVESGIYTFEVDKEFKRLSIATNDGYEGFRVRVSALAPIKDNFSFDVAIEEAVNVGIINSAFQKHYSIERTLAEKFVSMYQHLAWNGREKDLIDIRDLIDRVDYDELIKFIKEMIIARSIPSDKIEEMHRDYHSYEVVIKTNATEVIGKIILDTLKY